jgi:hypothetical protein
VTHVREALRQGEPADDSLSVSEAERVRAEGLA